MRITGQENVVKEVSLYLTVNEAEDLIGSLQELLRDPEGDHHEHVSDQARRRITMVIITPSKIERARDGRSKWSEFGRKLLEGELKWGE